MLREEARVSLRERLDLPAASMSANRVIAAMNLYVAGLAVSTLSDDCMFRKAGVHWRSF